MKGFYIIIAFLSLILVSCSQEAKTGVISQSSNEDISESIAIASTDSIPPNDRLLIAKKVLVRVQNEDDDLLRRRSISELALIFFALGSLEDFNISSDMMLRDAIKHQDTFNIAKAFRYKSEYFKKKGITDSAFYYLLKAERAYVILNDRVNLGKVLLAKGVTQYYGNDYLGAELSITKAYGLLKNSTEKQLLYESVTMMGIIANDLKDYDKAIEYHTKAFQLAKEHNLNDELNQEATSLNNIGNVYQNTNQDKNAIHYFSLALSNKKNIIKDFPGLFAMLTDNLAYSKFKLGDNNGLPQLFFDALRIRDSLGFNSGIVYSKLHLSEYYAAIQDTVKAKNYSEEAFATAKKSGAPSDILASLQQLATVDHKKASSYSREYIKITDSLQQAERKSKDKFARIQFETDEISLEKDKLEEQNRNLLLFFVGTVMIGLLLFVIRNQRARNRELLHKQAQQKANEDIYNLMLSQQNKIEEGRIQEKKRIAQELHDGVLGRLFGARLNLDSLNKLDGEHAEEKRNNYLAELKNIEQDIREISHDLNREKFVLINNFIAILNNLLEEQAASFDAEVVVNVDQSIKWERISNSLKINLYRIVQEALQNINKYAKASQIQVHLKQQNGNIVLNITDNGVGFAVEKKSKGIGLQNMVSRANECEGFFDIKSKKGKGTTINIEFPIENKPITA